MKVYNHKDAFEHLKYLFRFQKEDCFIAIFTESAVHYGDELWFNEDKVKELNLETFNLQRKGGAIVTSPGDVVYCFFLRRKEKLLNNQITDFLVKKLEDRHINVELVDNDLLIDGKKFFGCMQQEIGKMHFIGGHISIDCNLDLIKQICTKPIEKTPTGLSQYQVATKDVIDWLQEFWFRYKK